MQSARARLGGEEALALLDGVTDLYVAKGRKTVHLDLAKDRPADEEILRLILGRTGNLRAPALRTGTTFIVGYNADILSDTLL